MLPIHPHPCKDELFSSWLTRLSVSNSFYLHEFYKIIIGVESPIFTRDVDILTVPGLIRLLSQKTGIKQTVLNQSTLNTYTGLVYEKLNPNGHSRWVLPLGIYHRTRKLRGIQYCPRCLEEDAVRYFRKQWRLSFITVCVKHNCYLRDSCPHCSSPVDYQRIGIGRHQFETPSTEIGLCHQCLNALWDCDSQVIDGSIKVIAYQYLQFVTEFAEGKVNVAGLNLPISISEFNGLWILVGRLSGRRAEQLRKKVLERTGIELVNSRGGLGFDYWGLMNRFKALAVVFWILEEWPIRLINLALGTKFSKSVFSDQMQETPYWLQKIIDAHFDLSRYVVTDEEILTAAKYLRKRGNSNTLLSLSKLLNIHVSSCRERVKSMHERNKWK